MFESPSPFSGLRVLVIGDAMLDVYLHGRADRICPEAPAPIVTVTERRDHPGGAANTAANLAALGAEVTLLSVVGSDSESATLRGVLRQAGVHMDGLVESAGRRSLTKQRLLVDEQLVVRIDQGSTRAIDAPTERRVLDLLRRRYAELDAIVVSDYGYGVLTPTVILTLHQLRRRCPRLMTVDTKDWSRYRRLGVDMVKPNALQALALLGVSNTPSDGRVNQLIRQSRRILDETGARVVAVTLDRDGALVFERGQEPYRAYARSAARPRPAGAGDTFLSTMTLALASGSDARSSAELACAAAGVAVSKDGTAVCTREELLATVTSDRFATTGDWPVTLLGDQLIPSPSSESAAGAMALPPDPARAPASARVPERAEV